MKGIILIQLQGMRACLDAAIALMEAWEPGEPEPAPPPAADGVCRHEYRIPAPVMGRPKAWLCRDCNFEGEDAP